MRVETIAALTELIGEPYSKRGGEPKKFRAWRVRDDFDVIVQLDSPKDGSHAIVWMPCSQGITTIPCSGFQYAAGARRHANLRRDGILSADQPAMSLTVQTSEELQRVIQAIQEVARGAIRNRQGKRRSRV